MRSSLLWVSEMESSRTHFEVLRLWPRSLQIFENCLVLGQGQHYFLNHKNFVGKRQKPCGKFAFFGDRLKKFLMTIFLENTCACVLGPWLRAFLSLALASDVFCVLGLESCVLDSASGDYDFTGRTPESGLSLKCVIYIVCFTLNCRTLVVLWLGMKISFHYWGIALRFYWIKKLVAEVALLFWKYDI